MGIMIRYRHRPWFPLLSVLMLAVFIQAQAAGCCKIGSWFLAASKTASASGTANAASAGATEHACCPKPASDEGIVEADASGFRIANASVERTCCIRDTDLNAAEIPSIHDGSSAQVALPNSLRVLEILSSPRSEAFAASAFLDSGPPASRSALPLLI